MAISVDRELTLGVLFKGRVDATFTAAVNELRTAMAGVAKDTTKAGGAAGAAVPPTKKLADENAMLGKRIGQVAGGFQRLTQAMKVTAAYGLAATVIFGLINTLKKGSSAIVEYSQTLKNLQAITGATDAQIGSLGSEILKVASNTKYSAKEVGDAAILLGQAGFSAAESLASIGAVANLATGTLSNMADVADLMTTAIRAFGLEASDSTEIADIFAVAVNKSKLTIDKLRTAFNYLGPIANQVGINLKETAAGAMILANAGFKASTIGTGFRQVLARLVNPSEKLKIIFKSVGADLEKLNPATSTFRGALEELEKVLGKTVDKADKARLAIALFGLRGSAAASAFAQAGIEGYDQMIKYLNIVGAAEDMAKRQMEGLGVMIKNLGDKFHNLAIILGKGGIAGAFETLAQLGRSFADILIFLADNAVGQSVVMFTSLITSLLLLRLVLKYLIVEFIALSLGLTIAEVKTKAAAAGVGLLNLSLEATGKNIKAMGAAFTGSMGPVWAAVIAFAAIATGLVMYRRHIEQAKQKLEEHAIEIDSNVIALKKFQEKIEENNKKGIDNKDVIERLVKAYPELATSINLGTMAFKDQGKALQELTKFEEDQWFITTMKVAKAQEEDIKRRKERAELIKREKGSFFIEGMEMDYDAVGAYEKALHELGISQGKYELIAEGYAKKLRERGTSITASYEEIKEALKQFVSVGTVETAERLAKAIKDIYDKIEPPKETKRLKIELIKGMSQAWKDYYKTLDEDGKTELLLYRDRLNKKIESAGEAAMEALGDEKIAEEQKERMRKMGLVDFILKEEAKVQATKDYLTKLEVLSLDSQNKQLEADILSSKEAFKTKEIELKKMLRMGEIDQTTYNEEIVKLAETAERDIYNIKIKYRNKEVDRQARIKKEMEDEVDEISGINLKIEKDEDKVNRRREKNWERMYNLGIVSAKEYEAAARRAHDQGTLSDEEFEKKLATLSGSSLKSFEAGLRQAKASSLDWANTWYEIGLKVEDTIATNMTNGMFDFIDRTKSATEAMNDFGRNTLRWLAEIIIKQQILNGLRGISAGTSFAGLFGIGHTGGIVGKTSFPQRVVDPNIFSGAKRYGGGGVVGANEYPIIAHKDEGIFTPEQMKALGGGGQNIRIEMINKSGTPLKASSSQPKFDMGQMILNVVLEGTSRNKGGFKDQMRGALSG